MSLPKKSGVYYLSQEKIIVMLNKFLIEKGMPEEQLTKLLEIKSNELDILLHKQAPTLLIRKVNLPLIKLFCATKFDGSNN